MPNNIFISVIMPALNEGRNITAAMDNVLSSLNDYNLRGEIIVINDGSIDGTPDIVKEKIKTAPAGSIRMINHDSPKGIGASFHEGVQSSKGNVVIVMPGDNENDPWEIFRYAGLLDDVDIVIPFVFNKEVRSLFRNILSGLYRLIINTTFRVNFNYTNGTILYRKSILLDSGYKSSGFFFQTEILIKAVKNGYIFAEVPYRLGMRPEGVSKAVTFPSFLKVVQGYMRLVRDVYLDKDARNMRGKFSEDSQSAKRYVLAGKNGGMNGRAAT